MRRGKRGHRGLARRDICRADVPTLRHQVNELCFVLFAIFLGDLLWKMRFGLGIEQVVSLPR